MTGDGRARYWGELNRLRAIAAEHYGAGGPVWASHHGSYVAAVIVAAIGAGLVAPLSLAIAGRALSWGDVIVPGILALVGVFLLWASWKIATSTRDAASALRRYQDRSAERERWRQALAAFAGRCGGAVDSGHIASGCRFLVEHWPDRAPELLLHHQGDGGGAGAVTVTGAVRGGTMVEARLTAVGKLDECPVLVQIIDLASERGVSGIRPPALVILVAGAIEIDAGVATPHASPFRTSQRPAPEASEAHRELAGDGFVVTWTRAGVAATHPGPASALLDAANLERAARAVHELCRSATPGAPAPPALAPPAPDASSLRRVLEGFLSGLRDRDALAVLALAHPRLFRAWSTEPTPEELVGALDEARAIPSSWNAEVCVHASTGGSRTIETLAEVDGWDIPCANLAMSGVCGGRAASMNVYVLRLDGSRWQVSGFSVNDALVLGVPFPESS